MWITREEAIVMYAKFCRSHYEFNAYQKVKERASQLADDGDFEGEKIWNQVAAEIEKAPFPALSFRVSHPVGTIGRPASVLQHQFY